MVGPLASPLDAKHWNIVYLAWDLAWDSLAYGEYVWVLDQNQGVWQLSI
jgi:hypothetical protein